MSNVYLSESDLQAFLTQMGSLDTKLFSNLSSFSKLLKSLAEEGFVSGKVHSRLAQIQFYAEDTFVRFSGSCFKSAKPILETYISSVENCDSIMFGPFFGLSQVHDYSEGTVSANASVFSDCNGLASELQNVTVTYDCSSDKVQEYISLVNQEVLGYVSDINNLMERYSSKYQSISEEVALADSETAKKLAQVVSNLNFVYGILSRLFSIIATPAVLLSSDGQFETQLSAIVYDRYFEKDGTLKKRAIQNLTDIFTKNQGELSATDVQFVSDILLLINKQRTTNTDAYTSNLGAFISAGYINNYREPKTVGSINGHELRLAGQTKVVTMEDIGRMALNCECSLSTTFVGTIAGIQTVNSDDKEFLDTANILNSVIKYKSTINITHTLTAQDVQYTGQQIPRQGIPIQPMNYYITGVREYTAVYAVKDDVLKKFYNGSKAKITISIGDGSLGVCGDDNVYTITSNEATNDPFTTRITIDPNSPSIPEAVTNQYHDYEIYVTSTKMSDVRNADNYAQTLGKLELLDDQSTSFNLAQEITKEVVGKVPGGSIFISLIEGDYASAGTKAVKTGLSKAELPSTGSNATVSKVSVDKKNNVVKVSTTARVPSFVGDTVSSVASIYKSYAKTTQINASVAEKKATAIDFYNELSTRNNSNTYYTVRAVRDNYVTHGNGVGKLTSIDICDFDGISYP